MRQQRVGAAEGAGFRGGIAAMIVALRLFRNPGDEIGDSDAAITVEPQAALHSVSIAGVADEGSPKRAHVVGAAGDRSRDLVCAVARAAVKATFGIPIGAVV